MHLPRKLLAFAIFTTFLAFAVAKKSKSKGGAAAIDPCRQMGQGSIILILARVLTSQAQKLPTTCSLTLRLTEVSSRHNASSVQKGGDILGPYSTQSLLE